MMGKTKVPSLNNEASATMGKRVAEVDHPQEISQDTSADMKEDELAAFKKIMGDIDDQEEKQSSGSLNATGTGDKDEQEVSEEESAALNEDIETLTSENPSKAESVDSEDSQDERLDEDQQKAFESIMAQIESDGLVDADSPKETGEVSDSKPVDDLSAGQEKVVKEADVSDDAGPANAQPDELTDDDGLDPDQQQALESIMVQIEGGDTGSTEPVSTTSASAVAQSEDTPEDQEPPAIDPTEETSGDESHHISYDIEEILTEIALSDDESPLQEAASGDSGSEKATVEASENNRVDDDIVAHQKADSGLAHPDRSQMATSAGQNGKPAEPDESPLVKGPSVDPRPATQPTPTRLKDQPKPETLREAGTPAVGRKMRAVLASVVAILFLALGGFFYGISNNMLASKPVTPDKAAGGRNTAVVAQSVLQEQKPEEVLNGPSDQSRLKNAAENLDRLRSQFIDKQAEIDELRAYYQTGIDAEIQSLADKLRNAGKGKIPFKSAIADPSISLGLSAIQRRDTYIKKLETPLSILVKSSESLLFFSRKAALLGLMAGKTSDIDIDGFIKQTDEIRDMHGSELARLNIDTVSASPRRLESIWQDIEKRMPMTAVKTDNLNRGTDTDNEAIWKNICDGDFSQKDRLTVLSPEAAGCLTAWKGKDLFLNAVTDLSPDAARHLSAWEGDWLGLNGLTKLSPGAAVYLSRWKGKGLSLNSLSSLSPRVVAILSDWQGDQIELINVKHMVHWDNPKTRLFLSEDLKRKLNAARK